MKIIARYKAIFVDLFGMAYLIGVALVSLILSLTNWLELKQQEQILINSILFFFAFVQMGLLNSNFFLNFIGRSLI